jgi:hypothetical protein
MESRNRCSKSDSHSTDGGRTWADPVPIMDMGEFGGKPQKENGCSDPNILIDPKTGEILDSAVWTRGKPGTHQWRGKGSEPGHGIHRSSQFMMVRSRDHGKSWMIDDRTLGILYESSRADLVFQKIPLSNIQ